MIKISENSIYWIILQQIFQRGLTALKFFMVAKVLGATNIGLISLLLIVLAILEAISDFGMNAIYVTLRKKEEEIDDILWTWQFARGLIIYTLYILIVTISYQLKLINFMDINVILIYAFGLIILFKTSNNIKLFKLYKEKKFKINSYFIISFSIIDFLLSIVAIFKFESIELLLVFMILTEFFKMIGSFLLTPIAIKPKINFNFRYVDKEILFGKSIWKNNVIITFLSQLDKLTVMLVFSPFLLGIYQMFFKLSSLIFSDSFQILNQYFLSTIAKEKLYGNIEILKRSLKKKVVLIFAMSSLIAIVTVIFYEQIVLLVLTEEWLPYKTIFLLLLISTLIGSWNSLLVTFFKAFHMPSVPLKAVYSQIIIFIPLIVVVISFNLSLDFIAGSVLISNFCGFIILFKELYDLISNKTK